MGSADRSIADRGLSWEQAVAWLVSQPAQQDLVRHCYFDEPIEDAARRFVASEEWSAIRLLLRRHTLTDVLDTGAGRGISSYAFAQAGCQVVALEPDGSAAVGAAAIARLSKSTGVEIDVLTAHGERLPIADAQFDLVYGRAVLHHAGHLTRLCREAARVLKPGGVFLATREHVITHPQDLPVFLAGHPLHFLYGGENAYVLREYVGAIELAGLRIRRVIGPFDSVINFAPMTTRQFEAAVATAFRRYLGQKTGASLAKLNCARALYGRYQSARDQAPGRHYSFLAVKPR